MPKKVKPGSDLNCAQPEPDARAKWVNRLGNLMLLNARKNSKAQDGDFKAKKDAYFKSQTSTQIENNNIPLTDDVAKLNRWSLQVLEQRQRKHLASAKKLLKAVPLAMNCPLQVKHHDACAHVLFEY